MRIWETDPRIARMGGFTFEVVKGVTPTLVFDEVETEPPPKKAKGEPIDWFREPV